MAMGIVIPVLPQLIEEFAGSTARASWINGGFVAVWGLMQFIASPVVGSLSDRFGRRPVILVSTAGLAADYVLMALAPNLWWLLVGRIIAGVTSASFTTVFAYMADVTPPEARAKAYGLIGAAFGLGFVLGPLLGGALGEIDPRAPFWAAAALSCVAFLYGALVLPESLPVERRMAFSWRRANPLGALALLRSHAELFGLAMVSFLAHFAHNVFPAVFVLYAAHRYGWSAIQVGGVLALVGVCDMVVQGLLVGPVVKTFGERRALVAGLCIGALGFVAMGLAFSGWLFIASMVPMALWGIAGPAAQALMTRRVSLSEQGQLQGAIVSLTCVAGMVAPLIFGGTYALFIGEWAALELPGAPFLLAAAALALAAGVGWRTVRVVSAAPTP
jgi:DHA1 family tetracycline resistance protein-like MFS transporter